MKSFEFTITMRGLGEDATEAWNDAVTALAIDPGEVPEDAIEMDEDE